MFPTISLEETGKKLQKIMKERGITVKEMSDYLNVSKQGVYHWLKGISLPSTDNLYALSYWLNLPMDELVCGNKEELVKERKEEEENSFLKTCNNRLVA